MRLPIYRPATHLTNIDCRLAVKGVEILEH
jgi:hypothetical protein